MTADLATRFARGTGEAIRGNAMGTATGSTNHGPHSTNVSNKLDPRVDSDIDHRADPTSTVGAEEDPLWSPSSDTPFKAHEYQHGASPPHEHRGSIGDSSSLKPANKLDPIFHVGPEEESMKYTNHPHIHRLRGSISGASGLEAAQKLDPPEVAMRIPEEVAARLPDEVKARSLDYSQPDSIYHQPKPVHKNSILNMLDPDVDSSQYHKNPSPSESGRYSPDMDDGIELQSRRRSRKSQFLGTKEDERAQVGRHSLQEHFHETTRPDGGLLSSKEVKEE
ncbi:cell surface [Pyrenophora seminiperda CCB06]|uniref:Cell surface n=1 Tax=Pyrenophora seminiperda CCB06 TaxID=1302712 RepID=A0A3M7MBE3_9PLEO|nr:cell surface [Pyrenophora seminiperda CCB06]